MRIQTRVQPQLLAAQRATTVRLFNPAQIVTVLHRDLLLSVSSLVASFLTHAQSPAPTPTPCNQATIGPRSPRRWRRISGTACRQCAGLNNGVLNSQPGDKLTIPAAMVAGRLPPGGGDCCRARFLCGAESRVEPDRRSGPAHAYLSTQRQAAQSLAGFRNTWCRDTPGAVKQLHQTDRATGGQCPRRCNFYTVDMEQGRLVNHQYDAIYPVVLEAAGWRIGQTQKYDEIGALSEGALAAWFADDLLHGGGASPITPTPTPIMLPPPTGKALVTYLDCPADAQQRKQFASVHNRLYPGAIAIVLPSVSKRLLYESENYSRLIGELPLNRQLYVLDGPRCVQGDGGNYYQRWRVKDLQSGVIGWTSEGGRDDDGQLRYWLAPLNLYQACPGYPSRIKMGDAVYTPWTVTLSLRRAPSSSASAVVTTRLEPGKVMRVVGGPECADGWTFWLLEVGNSRYYASEGDPQDDPNNPKAGYWLVPLVNSVPNNGATPTPMPPSLNSPTQTFLAYQDAINRREFATAYGLLSAYFRDRDLCKLKQLCDAQTFGNGFRGKDFVSASDIRNEHQGWNAAYWVFDATFHPAGTVATHQNTICMLLENGQWKVHGILVLGSKSCG
ncbi:MAG: hypothetical protein U0175_32895 [Caldilineaceae bacterium]